MIAALLALAVAASPAVESVPVPKVPLHAVYTVETNKLGQVVRVVSAQATNDRHFNEATRGNALQAFIRRPDGTAVAGVYKLIYDYTPKNGMLHRDVQLVRAGGVDPNAKGAVTVQLEKNGQPSPPPPVHPSNAHLPDFDQIVSPAPSK